MDGRQQIANVSSRSLKIPIQCYLNKRLVDFPVINKKRNCACYSFDTNKDKFIDFDELKRMMEKVGSPQTHLALKAMIREVDEDGDNRINFREVG